LTSPALPPAIAALGQQIARMQAQIAQLQRSQRASQLGNTSIDNGTLTINDPSGNGQMQVGLQGDGTFTVVSTSTTPPPVAPDNPVVTPGPLSVLVSWDGLAGGAPPLSDFAACQVHCSPLPGFTPGSATLAGHLTGAGLFGVGGLTAGTTYYVALAILNEAGLASPVSGEVSATALPPLPAGSTVEGVYFIAGGGGGSTWTTAEPGAPGYFLYWDNGSGSPQVVYSAAATAGSDQWGGSWQGGSTYVGLPGVLPNVLTVTDTGGDTLAGIDSSGNITGATVNAGTDVTIGGVSVAAFMGDTAGDIVNRGWTPGTSASPWPATAITGMEGLLELDFTIPVGHAYLLQVLPCDVLTAAAANTQHLQRLYYTTDGSTPSVSSTEVSGHSPAIFTNPAANINLMSPYMEWIPPTPLTSPAFYRVLLGGGVQANSYRYANSLEMRVTDLGDDNGQFGNSGVILGTGGTSGGGGGKQTFTDTFYPSATYSYYSGSGLRNTNGNMFHGAYSGEAPAYQYSYIAWQASGSGGRSLAAILSGYTVNWARLRLTCLHSWYDNGMRFGLHTSTSLGGGLGTYSTILNAGGTFIGEGATASWGLSPSQISAMFAANVYTVLAPDSADDTNLSWYGYMWGGGGNDSYMPCITVSYTG
jgi:hypothetical protein